MYQDSFNGGVDYPAERHHGARHPLRAQRPRPHDRGHGFDRGRRQHLRDRQPRRGAEHDHAGGRIPATANFATPKPKRQFDALEVTLERRFSKNWFASAQLHVQPSVRQLLRPGQLGRDQHADDRRHVEQRAAAGRHDRPPGQQRAYRLGHRPGPLGLARQPQPARAAWRRTVRTS